MNNSRSETGPKTPTRPVQPAQQATPTHNSSTQQSHQRVVIPPSKSKTHPVTNDDNDFGWSASNESALVAAAQTTAMAPPQTPRKTPRNPHFTSPGKRSHPEMESHSGSSTSAYDDDVFNTPRSSQNASGLLSPAETPMRGKSQDGIPPPANSNLAADTLCILQQSKLSPAEEQQLVALLNKHDLRTQGIAKGRDITRLALGNKEKKITELEARIASLEAERETSTAVIADLKRYRVQTSPSKGRKRGS